MSEDGAPKTPWHHSGIVVALGLILCAPIGLGLLWDSKGTHVGTKIVATLLFGGLWLFGVLTVLTAPPAGQPTADASLGAPANVAVQMPTPVAEQPADDGSFGPGTMVVGKDIEPGSYRSAGATPGSPLCYAARLSGFSGEPHELISNELVQPGASVVVTIKPTDVGFKSNGCARWEPLE